MTPSQKETETALQLTQAALATARQRLAGAEDEAIKSLARHSATTCLLEQLMIRLIRWSALGDNAAALPTEVLGLLRITPKGAETPTAAACRVLGTIESCSAHSGG